MEKPTIYDIAKTAGVSLATVDRVLNARPGVREVTVRKVNAAVSELGYVRDLTAANLARRRQYRFVFLLPAGDSKFVEALQNALLESDQNNAIDRTTLRAQRIPMNDPYSAARAINLLDVSEVDGVAIMAPETPQVRDAVTHLKENGIPVVALVSDLPNTGRDHFVGINNVAAGRTAGNLLGRFIGSSGGRIAVIANSLISRDSLERRRGFDSILVEEFPGTIPLPTVEGFGDASRVEEALGRIAEREPDLAGIYSIDAGTQAVLDGVRRVRARRKLSVVGHELTTFTRGALQRGELDAVINQDVGHLVRSSLRLLRAKCDGIPTIASQERIRIEIILRDNMPDSG
jgi:LacI family transcriptional regulator